MQTKVNWKLYCHAALSLTSSARASLHRSSCFPLPALIVEQDTKTPPLVAAKRMCPLHRFPGLRLILIPAVPHVAASSVQARGHYRTTPSTKSRNGLPLLLGTPRNSIHRSYEEHQWQKAVLTESNTHREWVRPVLCSAWDVSMFAQLKTVNYSLCSSPFSPVYSALVIPDITVLNVLFAMTFV